MCIPSWPWGNSRLTFRLSPDLRFRTFRQITDGMMSEDREIQLVATTRLKLFLTAAFLPPVDEVSRSDLVVHRLVQFFNIDDFPELKYEAAFVLAYLTQSGDIDLLVDCGTVPLFVQLLGSDREEDRSLGVHALREIARKSKHYRDFVLNHGAMMPLLALFNENSTPVVLKVAASTVLLFYRGGDDPHPEQTNAAIPALGNVLHFSYSDHVLSCACSVLVTLAERGNPETIPSLCDLAPQLIQLFDHSVTQIQLMALRLILHILKGDHNLGYTQKVADNGLITGLLRLLTNKDTNDVKFEVSRILFLVTVFNKSLVMESGLIGHVIEMLQNNNFSIQKYALRVVFEVTIKRNHEHTSLLGSQVCIQRLCDLLASPQEDIVCWALISLAEILNVGKLESNAGEGHDFPYRSMFVVAGGLAKLEHLLETHPEEGDITKLATRIVFKYFC